MNRGKRFWLAVLSLGAAIATAAGISLGVLTLAGVTFEGASPDGQAERPPGVTICVQAVGVDAAIEPVADEAIEAALVEAAKHSDWARSGRGAGPSVVDVGCPSEPLTSRSGVRWKDGIPQGSIDRQFAVPQRGYYRLFVFVMPISEIERLLGGVSPRYAPQEITLVKATCAAK